MRAVSSTSRGQRPVAAGHLQRVPVSEAIEQRPSSFLRVSAAEVSKIEGHRMDALLHPRSTRDIFKCLLCSRVQVYRRKPSLWTCCHEAACIDNDFTLKSSSPPGFVCRVNVALIQWATCSGVCRARKRTRDERNIRLRLDGFDHVLGRPVYRCTAAWAHRRWHAGSALAQDRRASAHAHFHPAALR